MVGSFVGVLILVNTKIEGHESTKSFDRFYLLGIILAVFEALSCSVVFVVTRKMKEVHFSVMQINYTFLASSFQLLFLFGRSFYNTGSFFDGIGLLNGAYSYKEYLIMCIASFFNIFWMMCMTVANQMESSVFLSIFSYITVVYALISDFLIFHYTFKWQHYFGGSIILIVTFTLAILRFKDN